MTRAPPRRRAMLTLGIDLGTSGVKARCSTTATAIVRQREPPLRASQPRPGFSEQDPEDWWRATCAAARRAAAARIRRARRTSAIGLSGQMHGATLLDANDACCAPASSGTTAAARAQCDALTSTWPGLARRHQATWHARLHRAQADVWCASKNPSCSRRSPRAPAQGLAARRLCGRRDRGMLRRLGHALARRRPAANGRMRRLRAPACAPSRCRGLVEGLRGPPASFRPAWRGAGGSAAHR
jgi:hypothetical protein